MSGRIRPALFVLVGAVGVVMLIVCANLSNMLLARTAGRQKEIAIRTALGAGRGRLIRQMLTEGSTLSCCGAALGIILAVGGTRLLASLEALSIPLLANVRVDFTVLAFCLIAAALTGVVFGIAPALQAPLTAVHDVLKDTTRGTTGGKSRNWVRSSLVVSEIAFACVLLVGAGLLIRSFLHVLDVNLGFRPEHAAAVRVDPDASYSTQERQNAYFDDVLRRVRAIPGITAAGLTDNLPLGRNRSWGTPAKGQVYPNGKFPDSFIRIVTDGYREAIGIKLVAGRDLSERDTPTAEPVIAINETLARTLWPGQSASANLCGHAASAAWLAYLATCGTLRWSRARVWRFIYRCGNAAISRRSISSCAVHSHPPISPRACGPRSNRSSPTFPETISACCKPWSIARSLRAASRRLC